MNAAGRDYYTRLIAGRVFNGFKSYEKFMTAKQSKLAAVQLIRSELRKMLYDLGRDEVLSFIDPLYMAATNFKDYK